MNRLAAEYSKRLDVIDKFPGWERARPFLEAVVRESGFKKIADIGGGANPMISSSFVRERGIDYCLVDISQTELDKAPEQYSTKICIDLATPTQTFTSAVGRREFDLVFSHMFLEHIVDTRQAHRNMRELLREGGLAVHFYPSCYNVPLAGC